MSHALVCPVMPEGACRAHEIYDNSAGEMGIALGDAKLRHSRKGICVFGYAAAALKSTFGVAP